MASDEARRSATTTTTTTNTTFAVSHQRIPRASNQTLSRPSTASSQNRLVAATHDGVPSPRTSNIINSSEPFPSFPLEPTRSSQLSQIRTIDQIPLSSVESHGLHRAPSASTSSGRRPIGIKRLSSKNLVPSASKASKEDATREGGGFSLTGRRRSTSAPQRPTLLETSQDGIPLQHANTAVTNLSPVVEGQVSTDLTHGGDESTGVEGRDSAANVPSRSRAGSQRLRRVSDAARSTVSRMSNRSDDQPATAANEYDDNIVDFLDVIDPEVSTLTTLTNVQNSLFVPDLGRWLNRRPTFELTKGPSYRSARPTLNRSTSKPLPPTPAPGPPPLKDADLAVPSDIDEEPESPRRDRTYSLASVPSIASVMQEEHYAVLPHGVSLEGWSEEDKELLDDHVRHMLHSKREGFKRSMRAFGKYVSKPLGFFVTLYAVLITLFGLAWVLFLIGWIYVGEQQLYAINVIDNVLVALFAVMGDGLAPFRAVDTYHMAFIAHYHHATEKIRKRRELPKLQDHNELPEIHETEVDVETSIKEGDAEFSVLKPEQQKKLEHHQAKFSKSHSFYKPHETTTHFAFPHHLFVAIVILLDMHSCLQIALGASTWSTDYRTRPKALTPTILSCSITVNITAGILIKVGDNKTRKKDVLTRMFRQELTEEAMKRVEKDKQDGVVREKYNEVQRRKEKTVPEDRVEEENENNRFSSATMDFTELPKSQDV